MRTKIYCLLVIATIFCSCGNDKHLIVIQHVNFFDGEQYHKDVNIIIDSNTISDITREEDWPKNSFIINGKGKTIIPPLLNAHVHAWQPDHLKEAFRSGVFGVLDMHTTDEGAAALRQYRDSAGYAFYYAAGPGATVPGGHGTQYQIIVPTIDSSLSPEQYVEDRVKHHADYIKILREPSRPTIDFDQTRKVIDATHRHDKLCVAHVSLLADAMKLSSQGIDGFVHIWHDKKSTPEQLDSLEQTKLFMVPTLYVIDRVIELYKDRNWEAGILTQEEVLNEVYQVYKRGIPILAGTDPPNFGFNYGSDLFIELKLLNKAGIPNIEVLKAATSNVSRCFKLKEFAKLEKGSKASFVLINGDPLSNIDDIKKVEGLWKNGKQIR